VPYQLLDLKNLQKRLGHEFAQPQLLTCALTHRSFGSGHNERLEFLGDAVLNAAMTSVLFEHFQTFDEGDLTRVRSHLVCEDSLHRMALSLDLPDVLRLSEAEARSGGAHRPSMLADALEAIIGAIFLDAGFEAAKTLVARLFGTVIATTQLSAWAKDAKTELQEILQARRMPVPTYRIIDIHGHAHAQTFEVECAVPPLELVQRGVGNSRRIAEQEAAMHVLSHLKKIKKFGNGKSKKIIPFE
jgi:ribonuclease III